MAIQLIVGQGVTHNRIFLRKCARWSPMYTAPTQEVIHPSRRASHPWNAALALSYLSAGTSHRRHAASCRRSQRGSRGLEEVRTMQFGVMLPHRWLYAAGNPIADFAREAETLGYSSLWVTDHIIVPSYRTERGHIFYEALTTLAYVSSITTRCRLGVAGLALPPPNARLGAKQVATLDALSQESMEMLGIMPPPASHP